MHTYKCQELVLNKVGAHLSGNEPILPWLCFKQQNKSCKFQFYDNALNKINLVDFSFTTKLMMSYLVILKLGIFYAFEKRFSSHCQLSRIICPARKYAIRVCEYRPRKQCLLRQKCMDYSVCINTVCK